LTAGIDHGWLDKAAVVTDKAVFEMILSRDWFARTACLTSIIGFLYGHVINTHWKLLIY
jgi:hypothetical protein